MADDIQKIIDTMPVKVGIITKREYDWLKSFDSLEPHEIAKVEEYESHNHASEVLKKEPTKPKEKSKGLPADKATIWRGFKEVFYFENGFDFVHNESTLADIEPIIKYFAKDTTFFGCENLLKQKPSGAALENSFDKGLLIIGNYGNGKTSVMTALEKLFSNNLKIAIRDNWDNVADWNALRFKGMKSHDIVTEFETMEQSDKNEFYRKYSSFRYYLDDVKKEKVASNFGKSEIIREIIEKRYDKFAKTYITCNYKEGCANDLPAALAEFGERYGGHIYDRIFQMFNVIEFKGKSFRK